MTTLAISTLTEATTEGTGVFDVLMRANKAHLEAEFNKNRIKGPEYATVYLGSLTQVLQTSVQFLLAGEKLDLEKQLLEQQILLAQVEVIKANALVKQTEAQTELVKQQTANLIAEGLNIPKQGDLLDAQALHTSKQAAIAEQEILVKQQQVLIAKEELKVAMAKLVNIPKEGALLDAQALHLSKQAALVEKEILVKTEQVLLTKEQILVAKEEVKVAMAKLANIPKEGVVLDKQALDIAAKTTLTGQQTINLIAEALNIPKQGAVLDGQKCKLDAEYDLLLSTNLKTLEEKGLLAWKTTTEKAQTLATGVDADSVLGKQKALYTAQTAGFQRDAEQKAAKIMVDSWSVRRTTDEATLADDSNKLNDLGVGRAVTRLLTGVGA